jgi:hypothetical protein
MTSRLVGLAPGLALIRAQRLTQIPQLLRLKPRSTQELEVYFVEVGRDNVVPYAIGYERRFHKQVLTWKLSRMHNTRLLTGGYTVPESFDPRHYLSNAWGVMGTSGNTVVTVRLRFAPEAAYRVREGGYPNLTIDAEEPAGSLTVSVQAGADDRAFPGRCFLGYRVGGRGWRCWRRKRCGKGGFQRQEQ